MAVRETHPSTSTDDRTDSARAPAWLIGLLAVAAGTTVANLYYNQPLLPAIAVSFGVDERAAGGIPVVTQLGYGLGMIAVVPLGDRVERRRVIVGMTALAAVALLAVAAAPSLGWLLAASLALGLASMVPQAIVPYAAGIAHPTERGRVVGNVMSGLLIGILLSRTVSGLVGARLGWQAMYVISAGSMLALAVVLRVLLPPQSPERRVPWGELYRSVLTLVRTEPVLQQHAFLGALTFAAFSLFWSTLAFHLAALPQHWGSGVAGAFGVVGVAGALAAPLVGRFADQRDPRIINGAALATVALSFVVLGLGGGSLLGLGLGVILLDLGAQANHISNQTRIFGLDAALRNRLNTAYMALYFAGGAFGSWLGTTVYARFAWPGVCVAGALLGVIGFSFFIARVAPRG
ncbi:MFS permease [Minicystis rosea]|nr:MFS permease [Minicystis rosea]